jgi:hypothetical protein
LISAFVLGNESGKRCGEMPELRGEILMDEQYIHGALLYNTAPSSKNIFKLMRTPKVKQYLSNVLMAISAGGNIVFCANN